MHGEIMERTTSATITEIERSPWRGAPAKTIFFGGGTPTYLPSDQITQLLEAVLRAHPPTADCEITSEGNPGTVDIPKFAAMRAAGFNRISLGAQSFAERDLLALGRVHGSSDIARAVRAAREAGFENLNLDLMFALPGQTVGAWQKNLEQAIALEPDHLSLYCLTLEPNTPFYKQHLRGELVVPEDDAQVAMFEFTVEFCARHGFEQYEISNFARAGRECRHNLEYWEGRPYVAYGPGAVGCVPADHCLHRKRPENAIAVRYTNLKHPERYCDALESGGELWGEHEWLTSAIMANERVMLGLRLNRGIALDGLNLDPKALSDIHSLGWVEAVDGRVRLTPRGRSFCSEATLRLMT